MKYRLAKISTSDRYWYVIQRRTWFGWWTISDPAQKRVFSNIDEAVVEYENFLDTKRKTLLFVVREDEV